MVCSLSHVLLDILLLSHMTWPARFFPTFKLWQQDWTRKQWEIGKRELKEGLGKKEWENRLTWICKLAENVWEIEGWKGLRPKRLEHVRD